MDDGVFLIGSGQITRLKGPRGTTPGCPEALFKVNEVVKIRRLKHLKHLPDIGAIAAVVPPHFSPDWAWADLCGKPRPLLCQVPAKHVSYIVAFEGDARPNLMREKYLKPSGLPAAEIKFAEATP